LEPTGRFDIRFGNAGEGEFTSHRGCLVRVLEGHCRLGRLIGGKGLYFCAGSWSIGIVKEEVLGDKNLKDQIFVMAPKVPLGSLT